LFTRFRNQTVQLLVSAQNIFFVMLGHRVLSQKGKVEKRNR
jgi:hypothetical protein